MARKATDSVTLIGIDISRNGFDLIMNGRFWPIVAIRSGL
jgi:hypothetical protein